MTTNSAPIPTYAGAKQRADAADLNLADDWLDDWIDAGRSADNGQRYVRLVTKLAGWLAGHDVVSVDDDL